MYEHDKKVIEGGYVILPRKYIHLVRKGELSKPEFGLLVWLRSTADLFGITSPSMKALAEEVYNKPVSDSYINKLLLSLKKKRLIWYQARKGRRGSFEIHHSDWLLKDGKIKDIEHLFIQETVRSSAITVNIPKSEDGLILEDESQRIEERKRAIKSMLSGLPRESESEVSIQTQEQIQKQKTY